MEIIVKIIVMLVIFILFVCIYWITLKFEKKFANKENKQLVALSKLFFIISIVVSILMPLPMNYGGILQEKFDDSVNYNIINPIINWIKMLMQDKDEKEVKKLPIKPIMIISKPVETPIPKFVPTESPTNVPTIEPTLSPTEIPTLAPTIEPTPEPTPLLVAPNLIGMDEMTAINTCIQSGYTYSIEYYLGGNGTVIS